MTLGFFPYEPFHYKTAQAYLDKKAAKGLELRKIYLGCIARFEKAENPRHFVDLDLDKKHYDDPGQSYKDYFQLCADGGWLYVQTLRGMLFFRADPSKDPPPSRLTRPWSLTASGRNTVPSSGRLSSPSSPWPSFFSLLSPIPKAPTVPPTC